MQLDLGAMDQLLRFLILQSPPLGIYIGLVGTFVGAPVAEEMAIPGFPCGVAPWTRPLPAVGLVINIYRRHGLDN